LPSNDGWTALNNIVSVAAIAPVGAMKLEIFYAEAGTEQIGKSISATESDEPTHEQKISIGDFPVAELFPDGFMGHLWAVATDANGEEHCSETLNAIYLRQEDDANGDALLEPLPSELADADNPVEMPMPIFSLDLDNGKMALYPDAVNEMTATHVNDGQVSELSMDRADIADLARWLADLSFEKVEFNAGQTPGDSIGVENYRFTANASIDLFTYGKYGEDECFILYNNEWYKVANPSDPF
jgi:hypothetical protein